MKSFYILVYTFSIYHLLFFLFFFLNLSTRNGQFFFFLKWIVKRKSTETKRQRRMIEIPFVWFTVWCTVCKTVILHWIFKVSFETFGCLPQLSNSEWFTLFLHFFFNLRHFFISIISSKETNEYMLNNSEDISATKS